MGLQHTAPERDLILPGVEELSRQICELEQRVSSLERRIAASTHESAATLETLAATPEIELPGFEWTASVVALAGKALLGIAGAYLLRALTEVGVLPRTVGVQAGLAYSVVWLYLAARATEQRKAATAFNALTSVLILGPLLWEANIRFQVISTWSEAAVLVAFSATALVLAWRTRNLIPPRIAIIACALFAATMLVATHDLLPFTLALLAIAAIVELAACCDRDLNERWFVAGLACLSVLLLNFIVTRPGGIPEGYAPIPLRSALIIQGLLIAIYTASTLVRTFLQHRPFTIFETLLAIAVFLIGVGGALQVSRQDLTALMVVALFALMAGAACYAISFGVLAREGDRNRNFYIYATFAMLLVIAGSRVMLSGSALPGVYLVLALASCWAGLLAEQHILQLHGGIYLLLMMSSGLGAQSLGQFFGAAAESYPFTTAALAIAVTLLSYVALVRSKISRWDHWFAALVITASLLCMTAGLAVRTLILVWPTKPAPVATLGTGVLTLLAAVLAWIGQRQSRSELIWLMCAFMAVAAYKLLSQDFRQERTLPLVVSLLLYGGTLMLLPRILRKKNFTLERTR